MKLWRRIVWWTRRRRAEEELAAEIEFHRAARQEALQRAGAPEHEAAAQSRRAMGNLTLAREDARRVWIAPWCESVAQDVMYALRLLWKAPAFAIAIVIVMAVGIGATTTIFGLLDALVLRSLPVHEPGRLVYFKDPAFSYPIFQEVRARSTAVLAQVEAWQIQRVSVRWDEALEPTDVLSASGGFYSLLGISAAAGRLIGAADDRIGGGPDGRIAVISHAAWLRRFAGDRAAVGRVVRIGGEPFTIVGVAPPGFFGVAAGLAPEITIPLTSLRDSGSLMSPSTSWLHLIARLADGVSLPQANASLGAFWPAVLEATTNRNMPADRRARYLGRTTALVSARTGFSSVRNRYGDPLRMLLALVTMLLAVACASAANLWLARSVARRREIAVRLAIGAARGRLVRQLLTEAAVSTALGAAAGLALASWGGATLVAMMSTSTDTISLDLGVNGRVLVFTGILTAISAAVAAIVPALRATRPEAADSLKQHGAAAAAFFGRWSLAKTLVAVQIGLTAVLLVGAALFVRSVDRILSRDAGFDRHAVIVVSLDTVAAGYRGTRLPVFYDTLQRRLSLVPGIQSVSASQYPPISDQMGSWTQSIGIDGAAVQAETAHERGVYFNAVTPGYFRTLGMRQLHGRDFNVSDDASSPRVIIVNETLARSAFGVENPVGHHITIGRAESRKDLTIVGIVQDAKYQRLQEPTLRIAYLPSAQTAEIGGGNLVTELRVDGGAPTAAAIARAVREIDPAVPVRVETVDARIRESLARERVMATLATALAIAALVLACAAMYGLLTYTVARRTAELGLRFALGASRGAVMWMVVRGSIGMAIAGLTAGLVAAAALGRFVRALIFDMQPLDSVSFAAAAAIVLVITATAALVPARRAARVDPVVALRSE